MYVPWELKVFLMRISTALVFIALFFGGCHMINKTLGLEDDHFLEELTEEVLKNKTGIDIDLTS